MHIVVFVPKREYETDTAEVRALQDSDIVAFWTLSKVPKRLRVGERVYFVRNGRIVDSMRVIEIKQNSTMECDTTGRTWSGKCQIVMDEYREEYFDVKVKAFQGFAYMDRLLAKYELNSK